jgi:flagellar basal-body rod modification protein FlgD
MTTTAQAGGVSAELMAAMNPAKKAATVADSMDGVQDRFMTLLVTQMKNQDPLNPMDNAQVTSQLAQLSTVTGINKLNTTLEALQGSYQTSQSLQAVGMIGRGVLVPGSSIDLSDGKSVFGMELTEPADSVQVKIFDATGKLVRKIDLGAQETGALPLTWDGETDSGDKAANGQYGFEVIATRGGQSVAANSLSFGGVGSVSTGGGTVKLNVPGIGTFGLSDIRQVL